jgi:hypothetical protein
MLQEVSIYARHLFGSSALTPADQTRLRAIALHFKAEHLRLSVQR